jgi:hypothetical protein
MCIKTKQTRQKKQNKNIKQLPGAIDKKINIKTVTANVPTPTAMKLAIFEEPLISFSELTEDEIQIFFSISFVYLICVIIYYYNFYNFEFQKQNTNEYI